jgi:hypothetical protein
MALPTYQLYPTNRSAREVSGEFMLKQLDMDPPYQRDHVWTTEQRVALVKSWVKGVPIGAVILNRRDNRQWRENTGEDVYGPGAFVWGVVDGKQRIETARMWFNGELRVPRSWFEEHDIDSLGGPEGLVSCRGLTLPMQRHQGTTWFLPVIEATLPSPQAEAELFLLVNGGGTAQEPGVMEHARKLAGR